MIRVILPTIPEDKKTEEEVRKALLNLELQLNRELDELRALIAALTP